MKQRIQQLDELFFYDEDAYGKKLGVTYEKTSTEFVVWAPVATDVKVNIYTTGSNEDENALEYEVQEALNNLKDGYAQLVVVADKTALQAMVDKVNGLDEKLYTEASWQNLLIQWQKLMKCLQIKMQPKMK